MSLRDHLFSAGIINKKELRKSKLEAKKERKKKQGSRRRKHVVESEANEIAQNTKKHKREELRKARLEREAKKLAG